MKSNRGFSLVDILVTLGLMGVLGAAAIPKMSSAVSRNQLWTGAETIAGQIRTARLAAISRNSKFRVRFDCPSTGRMRVLAVTGDASIDNASNRCSTTVTNDGPEILMPARVSFGTVPTLEINNRGTVSPATGTMPVSIVVSYGGINATRTVVVTNTGRITATSSE